MQDNAPDAPAAPSRSWCEPPSSHAHRRWHWLYRGSETTVRGWYSEFGLWEHEDDCTQFPKHPENLASVGWRYLGPCLTPEEIELLLAEARLRGQEPA